MKESTRKTRSETRLRTCRRVDLLNKMEVAIENTGTSLSQRAIATASTLDPIVKVEAREVHLKTQAKRLRHTKVIVAHFL